MDQKHNRGHPKSMHDVRRPRVRISESADSENLDRFRFRDIIGAWTRQAIRHSQVEDKWLKARAQKERMVELKNDLKWALMADLDEPVKPRPEQTNQRQRRPQTMKRPVNINVNLGGLSKKHLITWVAVITVTLLVFVFVSALAARPQLQHQINDGSDRVGVATVPVTSAAPSGAPAEFHPLLLIGKTTTDVNNFQRVTTSENQPSYVYSDTFRGAIINVTELPSAEYDVAKIARDNGSNELINDDNTKIYMGSNSGQQSVVFEKANEVLHIQSNLVLDGSAWAWFAENLH